jgi:hypothetical protein
MPEYNKYFVDLTKEDKEKSNQIYNENDVINFIINNI